MEETKIQRNLSEYEWMVRPCQLYRDEYSECTSIRGRFHQYFIYGATLDCNQWKKDLDNCHKWESSNDQKALNAIVTSEEQRRSARLKAHYDNNVWEERPEPPVDWSKPLPEWMVERDKNTYLNLKSKEMKGEKIDIEFPKNSFCAIM